MVGICKVNNLMDRVGNWIKTHPDLFKHDWNDDHGHDKNKEDLEYVK